MIIETTVCRARYGLFLFIVALTVTAEASEQKKKELYVFAPSDWNSTERFASICEGASKKVEIILDEIKQTDVETSRISILDLYNKALIEIGRISNVSDLTLTVIADEKVRKAAEVCQQMATSLSLQLKTNTDVYSKIKAYTQKSALDDDSKKFAERVLLDYRRAGVDSTKDVREKLLEIQKSITDLEQKFVKNIQNGNFSLEIPLKDTEGMPEDFVAAKRQKGKDIIEVTSDYSDLVAVLDYAKNETVRKNLFIRNQSIAYPENEVVLSRLIKARNQFAQLLGYSDWADYSAEITMTGSKQKIDDFLSRISALAKERTQQELKILLAAKQREIPDAKEVYAWDLNYYTEKVKKDLYNFDSTEVRKYFAYKNVKIGVIKFLEDVFSVRISKIKNTPRWHEDVEIYNVYSGGKQIGSFYLDPHPRKGKDGGVWTLTILQGIENVQLPCLAISADFPKPQKDSQGLLSHGEVVDFFHEFGHVMKYIFAGKQRWYSENAIIRERDFVEVSSKLLEEWAWDPSVLSRFARHVDTGKPISLELLNRVKKSQEFPRGINMMREIFWSAISYYFHSKPGIEDQLLSEMKSLQTKFSPFPYIDGTAVFAKIIHLVSYGSNVYSYLWSSMIEKNIFGEFERKGLMNKEVWKRYIDLVLKAGVTESPNVAVEKFLGHPFSFEAFKIWFQG